MPPTWYLRACLSKPNEALALSRPMSESPSVNPPSTASNLKRALVDAGFEVFRTRGDEIVLAERPRENLIMDSGVRLVAREPLEVHVVLRAQKADFPNEDDARLFGRVRALATTILSRGFAEKGTAQTRVEDPGDPTRILDVFYEITFSKTAAALDDALDTLKFALALEKRA
jgi:hypothetical protein